MVHDGPVWEGVRVAEVAQVVAVAPYLLCQLRVAHRRAGHKVVLRPLMLRQACREAPDVVQHLQPEPRCSALERAKLSGLWSQVLHYLPSASHAFTCLDSCKHTWPSLASLDNTEVAAERLRSLPVEQGAACACDASTPPQACQTLQS